MTRVWYLQMRAMLSRIKCNITPRPNVSRILKLPRELQLEILLRLPVYDVIQLAYTIPELVWIRGCDRQAYILWTEVGCKLGVDPALLERLKEAHPTFALDLAHKSEKFIIDNILYDGKHGYKLTSKHVKSLSKYAGYLHTQLICYVLGRRHLADQLHDVLARMGEGKILRCT